MSKSTSGARLAPFDGARFDYVIVGGGSAGCVLASRLSETASVRVLLVEAGPDTPPGREPPEILSAAPSVIFHGERYLWPDLKTEPVAGSRHGARDYLQARVLGGGSSVNVQFANRGLPRDYDEWAAAGAVGWGWQDVLPYFNRLERDLDYDGPLHGKSGPIPVSRVLRPQWPRFSSTLAETLEGLGFRDIADQNGCFEDGFFATAYSNEAGRRVSAAMAYLGHDVRARPNLAILCDTMVAKLLLKDLRVTGVGLAAAGAQADVQAGEVILAAGALQSPAFLLRAGIGPAAASRAMGIAPVSDRPGVGANLRDHPGTHLCTFVPPEARLPPGYPKAGQLCLRFSSGLPGAPVSDLFLSTGASSGWHGVGRRIGYFYVWLNKPFSVGRLTLRSADPAVPPQIELNLLDDERDVQRMAVGFRFAAALLMKPSMAAMLGGAFPVRYSKLIIALSQINGRNAAMLGGLGRLLDGPAPLRRAILRHLVSNGPPLGALLKNPRRLEAYLQRQVISVFHPTGTCRIGPSADPLAVVDANGAVHGLAGIRVADASIMPTLPTANTNLPTIMVAEKLAAGIRAQAGAR